VRVSRGRDAALAIAVAGLAVALHLVDWDRGFVLLDEGYVATIADVLARGGAVYRDAVTYVLPGAYALLAAIFAIAGESLRVARVFTLVLIAALALFSYRVARAAMAPAAAVLAVALVALVTVWSTPQWQVYGYQQPGVVAVAAAAAALAAADAGARTGRLLVAGLLVGAAICTKQTHVVAAVALGAFAVADAALARGTRRWRGVAPLAAFAAGCAVPPLVALAVFAAQGTVADFWVQAVVSPLYGSGYAGYVGLPALRPLLAQDAELRSRLVHYLPPLLLEQRMSAIAASRIWRETPLVDVALKALFWAPYVVPALAVLRLASIARRARRLPGGRAWPEIRGGALLLAFALALVASTNRPLDWMHVSIPWIGTALLLVWIVAPGRRPARSALVATAAALVLLAGVTLDLVLERRAAASAPLALARAGVAARPADARVVQALVHAVQSATPAGEPILVVPYHPLVYFLADRAPATRFLFTWPVEYQSGRDREVLDAVDRLGVRTVVHGTATAPQLGTLGDAAPALLAGLVDRFRVAEVFGEEPWGISFLRLERRPPFPPSTRVLDAPVDGAHAAVWPFERVLAVELPAGGGARDVRIPIAAGDAGELVLGYGMNPDRWVAERPTPLVFEASLEREGEVTPLFSDRRDPQANVRERAWPERRFALDGRPATLVLRVTAPGGTPADGNLAAWTIPRIEPARSAGS